jgi:hypothetical protein
MRFIKPLDAALVLDLARSHEGLVTVEEGCTMGGAGSAVLECLAAAGLSTPVLVLGLPDVLSSTATRPSCWHVRPGRRWHRKIHRAAIRRAPGPGGGERLIQPF